ncbi:unnamed protein product [Pieris macdunnoughi]|uniref:Uncharacterized protein n=2 Tax=Pieris macdunnoughi TaxID=345717 RepID=A0A821WQ93_9NEOP|nr:unnamed protein product [Pieris macdunnoughi]
MNNKTRRHIYTEEFDRMYNGIDGTDELLSLKVTNGDPKVAMRKDGRRWEPPGGLTDNTSDRFSLKRRFLELMKQAIYQARNRMIIMQTYRITYRQSSVYKMGFLMSKTDQAVKTFARYTYKAFMGCFFIRLRYERLLVKELLEAFERELDLWFDIELLTDLVMLNDENCKRMLNQVMTNRKDAWKFVE